MLDVSCDLQFVRNQLMVNLLLAHSGIGDLNPQEFRERVNDLRIGGIEHRATLGFSDCKCAHERVPKKEWVHESKGKGHQHSQWIANIQWRTGVKPNVASSDRSFHFSG